MTSLETLGLLLAGGSGSRLKPMTWGVNKHLLPVYDKPLIFYPLSTLMLAGARAIRLVTDPPSIPSYQRLLGDGRRLGLHIDYVEQPAADGIVGAMKVALNGQRFPRIVSVLGDNVLYGVGLGSHLSEIAPADGGHIFAVWLEDASSYGVAYFDANRLTRLEEKPSGNSPGYAVPGLYFYDEGILEVAQRVSPSVRGELEISTLNQLLLAGGQLSISHLPRGSIWLDAGTPERLLDASTTISILQRRQGLLIGAPEEVAYRQGWIGLRQLREGAATYAEGSYARAYLENLADGLVD